MGSIIHTNLCLSRYPSNYVRSSTKSSLERKRNPYSSTSMMWSLLMVSVVTLPLTWSSPLSSTSSPPSTCNKTACSSIDQAWTCSNTANTNCETSSHYCNQAGGWTGQCVDDNGATKLLSDQNIHSNNSYSHGYPSSNNSVTSCIEMCRSKGYTYAGVEYGYQCFCGNTPPPSSKILPQSQCWYKCYGDPDQYCGGFHTMNVYTGCKSKYAGMDTPAECVNVRQADWKYIDQVYNINTEYQEGLCDTAKNVKDCCRCLKRKNFE